ncbi:hypothetical protein ACFLY7_01175 [Patescibacteria group bacterium]
MSHTLNLAALRSQLKIEKQNSRKDNNPQTLASTYAGGYCLEKVSGNSFYEKIRNLKKVQAKHVKKPLLKKALIKLLAFYLETTELEIEMIPAVKSGIGSIGFVIFWQERFVPVRITNNQNSEWKTGYQIVNQPSVSNSFLLSMDNDAREITKRFLKLKQMR